MAITLVRNPKESGERFIARFNKKVQQSRIVTSLKSRRYRSKDPSKRHMRQAALMRDHYRSTRERAKFH